MSEQVREKPFVEEFIDGILRAPDLTEWINEHALDVRLEIDLNKDIHRVVFVTGFGGPNEYIEIDGSVARHVIVEPGRRIEKEYESPKVREAFEILCEYFSEMI